ncbi:MAG TPA: pseudouridine synthase [Candidatus Dormibacteraeota bacterium]|nr:pseudouridine synthase [Candidatus Dormibacteraeota bacterium]
MIESGAVTVNGGPAVPGQQVTPEVDRVAVDGRLVKPPATRTYVMLNKPVGVLTSVGDPRGRPTVTDRLTDDRRLFPVGRLDLDSRGLVLLTDDGELAMRLMHPRFQVEKEYHVVIAGRPDPSALERLRRGMVIGAEPFQPIRVRILAATAGTTRVAMVLREGRKREVRRLWRALGHRVVDLQRVRIDGIRLGTLAEGRSRPLTAAEITRLKTAVS